MKNKIQNIFLIISAIGIGVLAIVGLFKEFPHSLGQIRDPFNILSLATASTSQKATVGTVTTTILATSTTRLYALLVNDSTEIMYCSLGGRAAGSQGFRLNSGGSSYEITPQNLFRGSVNCIASSTANMTVIEH